MKPQFESFGPAKHCSKGARQAVLILALRALRLRLLLRNGPSQHVQQACVVIQHFRGQPLIFQLPGNQPPAQTRPSSAVWPIACCTAVAQWKHAPPASRSGCAGWAAHGQWGPARAQRDNSSTGLTTASTCTRACRSNHAGNN